MRRLIIALGLTAALGLVVAAPAQAIPGIDCKGDPQITSPTTGAAGWLDPGPEHPRSGDPFAKDAKVSIYEVYGWAGLSWPNYDLGCGPDGLRDPGSTGAGVIASFMWGLLGVFCAAGTTVMRWAFSPNTLGVLEPIQTLGANAFGNHVFAPLFFITVCAVGLFIMMKSHKGDVRYAAHSAGWLALVAVAALAATMWPTKIAPIADRTVTGIVATVSAAVAGDTSGTTNLTMADGVAANIQRGIMFETWKAGMFGRNAGPVADKYGPDLFKAAALTRAEAAQIEADPSKAAGIYETHRNRYAEVAEKIKKDDPQAYEYLAGHRNNERVGFAALAWFGFWFAMLYLLVASFLVMFGLIVLRVAVMVFPAVAVVGAFPAMRRMVLNLVDYTFGALAAAAMFGSFAVVMAAILGWLLSPAAGVNPFLAFLLMLAFTVAGWMVSKPMRSVRTFINVRERIRWAHGRRGNTPGAPEGWTGDDARAPEPEQRARGAQPAEASTRASVVRAVVVGAAQGAAAGVAAGLVTGGAATVGTAAAGAAKGAGVAGATTAAAEVTGSRTAGAIAGTAAGRTLAHTPTDDAHALPPGNVRAQPAQGGAQNAPAESTAPAPSARATGAVRMFRPGEPSPADRLDMAPSTTEGGTPIQHIYTPPKEGTK